jgi:hypothetical protein
VSNVAKLFIHVISDVDHASKQHDYGIAIPRFAINRDADIAVSKCGKDKHHLLDIRIVNWPDEIQPGGAAIEEPDGSFAGALSRGGRIFRRLGEAWNM